jgi:hypothetical protein
MFPIAAGALSPEVALTTDATSPIHDAVRDHVMYDLTADGDRKSMVEIVQAILDGGEIALPPTIKVRTFFPPRARSPLRRPYPGTETGSSPAR